MQVNAKGILRHCFHGEYYAIIGLAFESPADAALARYALGADWTIHDKALRWEGNSDALKGVKAKLSGEGFTLSIQPCAGRRCRDKCASAEIDSTRHSIDYGPTFTLAVRCSDPNQLSLL